MPAIINSDNGVVSGSAGLKTSGANDGILALQNNGTTNVTVIASGNVGIGTSTPAVKLDVAGAISATGAIQASGVATNLYPLVAGTSQASTSGTSIDFTGIPSWVRRITVMLVGVSTNGTSPPQIQIGAGSVTTSGYLGSSSNIINAATGSSTVFTSGFGIGVNTSNWSAALIVHGSIVLTLQTGNTWAAAGSVGRSDGAGTYFTNGSLALGGTLDRVRITTLNGTDTFDAGSINILYE